MSAGKQIGKIVSIAGFTIASAMTSHATAQELFAGFLCCNYRHDGNGWMSDSNYGPNPTISLGAIVAVESYGRYRVNTTMNGARISLGNDYSRNLGLEQFAKRIITKQDPKVRFVTFPSAIREAISSSRIAIGMTKEQVLMALGYPVSSETPTLDAEMWRYWLSSFEEFSVSWSNDRVANVGGDRSVVAKVMMSESGPDSGTAAAANVRRDPTNAGGPVASANKVLLVFDGDSSRPYEVLGEVSVRLAGRSVWASGSAGGDAREEIKQEAKLKFGDSADAVINFRSESVTSGGMFGAIGAAYGARNTSLNASGVVVRFRQ